MVGCEIMHIPPTQSAKATEDEKVSNKFVTLLLESSVDEHRDFFFGKESSFGFFLCNTISIKRVAL